MVAEQRETVRRIDADTLDIASNVGGAQRELLKYYASISSNRWLMLKYPEHLTRMSYIEGNLKYTTTREAIQGHLSICGAFTSLPSLGSSPSNFKEHTQTRLRWCAAHAEYFLV